MAQVDKARVQAAALPRVGRPPGCEEFESFFRTTYRELLRTAMYVGATEQEAEDAAMATMEEVLRRWEKIDNRLAYARRAVVSRFLKDRTRGLDRVRHRQIERGGAAPGAAYDPGLTVWEDRQWVTQMLESLPPAQRATMAFVVDGFSPAEVADLLGKTSSAVRRNLCDARRRLKAALHRGHTAEQPDLVSGSPREEVR